MMGGFEGSDFKPNLHCTELERSYTSLAALVREDQR